MILTFRIGLFFLSFFFLFFLFDKKAEASEDFQQWLESYKKMALTKGISQNTINIALSDVKFLVNSIGLNKVQGKPLTVEEIYNKIIGE